MRRKVTGLVMALAMAMAFAACGGNDIEDISGKITPAVSDEQEKDDADITPTEAVEDKDAEPDATDVPEEDDAPKATEAPEENGKTTSLGRVQEGVYVNEYIGISCTLDSGWEFYTAEELQEFPEDVKGMFEGTIAEEQINALSYITDMSAENLEELATMNIIYQKMSLYEATAFKNLNYEKVVDVVLSQKDVMIDTYEQAGISVSELDKKFITFCGEKRAVIHMVGEYSEVPYYVVQLLNYDLGNYSTTITLASFVEDKTEELASLFSKCE